MMAKEKRHISVGLPGRLSINGFQEFDASPGFRRLSGFAGVASAMLMAGGIGLVAVRAEFLSSQPAWAWAVPGAILALATVFRTRRGAILLLAGWIALAVYSQYL